MDQFDKDRLEETAVKNAHQQIQRMVTLAQNLTAGEMAQFMVGHHLTALSFMKRTNAPEELQQMARAAVKKWRRLALKSFIGEQ